MSQNTSENQASREAGRSTQGAPKRQCAACGRSNLTFGLFTISGDGTASLLCLACLRTMLTQPPLRDALRSVARAEADRDRRGSSTGR